MEGYTLDENRINERLNQALLYREAGKMCLSNQSLFNGNQTPRAPWTNTRKAALIVGLILTADALINKEGSLVNIPKRFLAWAKKGTFASNLKEIVKEHKGKALIGMLSTLAVLIARLKYKTIRDWGNARNVGMRGFFYPAESRNFGSVYKGSPDAWRNRSGMLVVKTREALTSTNIPGDNSSLTNNLFPDATPNRGVNTQSNGGSAIDATSGKKITFGNTSNNAMPCWYDDALILEKEHQFEHTE